MSGELWVFAYGSLMWRPGFRYETAVPARLVGGQRSLCVYSVVYRGTPQRPGLVLGLEPGGTCEGMAFRVPQSEAKQVRNYLRAREQVTQVYREAMRPVELAGAGREHVHALCYLVDRCNAQYAGHLPLEIQAHIVRRGRGKAGANLEYVINTVAHLREAGIHDARLERLLVRLGRHK